MQSALSLLENHGDANERPSFWFAWLVGPLAIPPAAFILILALHFGSDGFRYIEEVVRFWFAVSVSGLIIGYPVALVCGGASWWMLRMAHRLTLPALCITAVFPAVFVGVYVQSFAFGMATAYFCLVTCVSMWFAARFARRLFGARGAKAVQRLSETP